MYTPSHFQVNKLPALHALVEAFPLGVFITHGEDGLDANHIPFELDRSAGSLGVLRGHVARSNPVWTSVQDGAEVLVVFRAEDGYISPSWYPGKHEAHRQVPTWNYRVVHAHGHLHIRDEEKFVRGVVARLTRRHEAAEPTPWKMGDAPADYINGMVQAIVGIEIEITRLEGKFKLGQNKDERDRLGAADMLYQRGNAELGQAMQQAGESLSTD